MSTYFSEPRLLSPPTERAAFSDRQAYVCAELAKLAYFRFEGGHTLQEVLEVAGRFIGGASDLERLTLELRKILTASPADRQSSTRALTDILNTADFSLIGTFSAAGTQGFFCTQRVKLVEDRSKTAGFLVFRGTETTDYRDILTDVRAKLTRVEIDGDSFEVHDGYRRAFEDARPRLTELLAETSYDQLFVTGHSLGGALAILSTRILANSVNGACYTFGAPPVGAIEVQNQLKTPVYQITNETDVVPRLPNPWLAWPVKLLLRLLLYILKLFTVPARVLATSTLDERIEEYVDQMTRFRHPGYVSYLVGTGSKARLRYNVSSFDRLCWWGTFVWRRRFGGITKVVKDHAIDVYISKLKAHGLSRQFEDSREPVGRTLRSD
jgi:pimeloyl-ACP methyl ester carboxylesterase